RHTRSKRDWSSDVCSSDLPQKNVGAGKTLPYKVSLLLAHRPQVDPQLLALLVKVAALEAERPGRVGHVELMRLEFAQDLVALEEIGRASCRERVERAGVGE